ncbi:MAG: Uncharacterised protein [Methanobacteriota archaeon]|nr:MAG: Uncharacterised protein [Euryarchaeota archaeon]|tara:strand:- start:80 stop:1171 length:1092 start_codon:yes stop_codon:yes gene_type:complete
MNDDDEQIPMWIHWPAAIISSIIGLFCISMIVTSTMAQLSTSDWDSTTGIIEDYDYFCDYNGEGTYCEEDIVYTYTIGDDIFHSDVTNLGWTKMEYQWYMSLGLTYGVTFEDGDEIEVYYNPYDPQKSVLIPGWDGIEFGDFFVLFLAFIAPSVLLIRARKKGTISEAINQFKELTQTAKEIQGGMGGSGPNYVQSRARRTAGGTSRERSYNSVINRLNLHSLQKDEHAIKDRIMDEFDLTPTQAQSFIQSEHVRLTLQLGTPPMPPMPPLSDTTIQSPVQNEEQVNNNQMDMMAVFASAMEENLGVDSPDSFEPKPLSSGMSYCEHLGCNVTVSNTDFRCFKCRRTFCYDHKGTSVVCPECS